MWLDGIDPPKRMSSNPNVTMLMIAHTNKKKGGGEEFGFIFAASRLGAKRKDREKECAKEVTDALDQLPLEDMKGWCQMPQGGEKKRDVSQADIDKLTTLVRRRVPKTTIEVLDPTAFVLVGAAPWGPHGHGAEPELAILDKFEDGFGELLREARRVSGMVRQQWFLAVVNAKPPQSDTKRPFTLGLGLATDAGLAKARALHAAEVRAQVLTDAMFAKSVPQKEIPASPA